MTASEPVPILDPEIEVMTFEQLAQLVNEVDPRTFYDRAQVFDTALAQLEQVQDNLERGTRELWDAWRSEGAESFADVVRNVAVAGNAAIQAMAAPGYGATLRRAGDALTLAQQRIRELQAQKRESDLLAARQVVHELGTAYQEIGSAITPFPGAETDIPVNGQGAAVNTAPPQGVAPGAGTVQLPAGDRTSQYGYDQGTHGGGVMPAAALVGLGGPTAQGQPGGRGDFWADLMGDPDQDRTGPVLPAALGRATPVEIVQPEVSGGTSDGQQNGLFLAVLGRAPGMRAESRETEPERRHKREDACENATSEPHSAPEVPNVDLTSPGASARADSSVKSDLTAGIDTPTPSVTTVSAAEPSSTIVPGPGPAEARTPVPEGASASAAVSSPPETAGPPETPMPPPEIPKVPSPPHGSGAGLPGGATPMSMGVPVQPAVTPVAGEPSLPGALPASPAFRPVTGSFDASVNPGLPPVVPGGAGTARLPGEATHGNGGGFMPPMHGGGFGGFSGDNDSEKERQPGGLLGVDPEVWDGSSNAPRVLGRSAAVPEAPTPDLDDAKKKAVDAMESILGRTDRKEEDRAAE
ncbi:hypothetical protein [Amycolatopsis keratiniphila]|uniref:WXG100 family type VII secretion target n=1 Tax=Amycolatopsis keratiniphila TaxID=129921 RepID=R4TB32_9PSEU|nr:hypothetical protein [Amycolatopsis keratiniphila]AGM08037.1 hypothetical protein AORI_5454 [Amycolatopsis keratiniphila]